ncbi:MAG TPA: phytoene/squalene synthase family protein [Steroidobacteraceae bacterium]|jgi:farnesyl-diphosphate farnesyltransferase|nr:phytoene/squalene synthase family protein [Steroidobacteraceae bacterium]
MDSVSSDAVYQDQILPHVSRTFALTIPQLPEGLRTAVTTAYLLCRIADTIEDEPTLSPPETLAFLQRFNAAVGGTGDPALLGREVAGRLSSRTLPTERDLVAHTDRVLQVLGTFNDRQRAAIQRCVELMCYGMPRFQFSASLAGLARASDLDDYCYYVAGVVGEMLTELFCDHSPLIAQRRGRLCALAASFAQGLQMTNILKDVWEDRGRGACWLPQEVFTRHGVDLAAVSSQPFDPRFGAGFRELVGVAHAHLRNALEYTLLIPRRETGIRRFCLWAIGLAVLTLRKIAENPAFTKGAEVKVKRSAVAATRMLTQLAGRSDLMLRALYLVAARGLPLAVLPELHRPQPVLARAAEGTPEAAPEPALRRSFGNSGS